jgi:hypothetical protein
MGAMYKNIILITAFVCIGLITTSHGIFAQDHQAIYVAAPNGLSLREEPSATSKRKELLAYGTKITNYHFTEITETIDGYFGYWCRIALNGLDGYIFSGFTLPLIPPKDGTASVLDYLTENFGQPVMLDSVLNYDYDGIYYLHTHYFHNSVIYTKAPLHDGNEFSLINLDIGVEKTYLLFYLMEQKIKGIWGGADEFKLLPFKFPVESYKNEQIEVKKMDDYREYEIKHNYHVLKLIFMHARQGLVWGR